MFGLFVGGSRVENKFTIFSIYEAREPLAAVRERMHAFNNLAIVAAPGDQDLSSMIDMHVEGGFGMHFSKFVQYASNYEPIARTLDKQGWLVPEFGD
jgi:hypothetical protein